MAKNTKKVREKSGNFVSPEKWEPCRCQYSGAGLGPQVNKFQQVSSDDYQVTVVGLRGVGPMPDIRGCWEGYPCPIAASWVMVTCGPLPVWVGAPGMCPPRPKMFSI